MDSIAPLVDSSVPMMDSRVPFVDSVVPFVDSSVPLVDLEAVIVALPVAVVRLFVAIAPFPRAVALSEIAVVFAGNSEAQLRDDYTEVVNYTALNCKNQDLRSKPKSKRLFRSFKEFK